MSIEKMVLYVLRNGVGLTYDDLKEIVQAVGKYQEDEIKKAIKKLFVSADIKEKNGYLVLLAKARRKMLKPNKKIPYNGMRWGKRWTMVLFDIPERNKKIRDILRYKLQKMGFGMMQGSVWVKPDDVINDVRRFIRVKNLQWQVKVLGFKMAAPDEKETIHRIWKMEKLNEEYRRFVKKTIMRFKKLKTHSFHNPELAKISLDLLSMITEKEYLTLYAKDPELPLGLLPGDWNGKRAHNIYQQLDKYLVR